MTNERSGVGEKHHRPHLYYRRVVFEACLRATSFFILVKISSESTLPKWQVGENPTATPCILDFRDDYLCHMSRQILQLCTKWTRTQIESNHPATSLNLNLAGLSKSCCGLTLAKPINLHNPSKIDPIVVRDHGEC